MGSIFWLLLGTWFLVLVAQQLSIGRIRPIRAALAVTLVFAMLALVGCEQPPEPSCPAGGCPDGYCPIQQPTPQPADCPFVSLAWEEIPLEIRQTNYAGGSCLYASTVTALRWMGQYDLAERLRKYTGGQHVQGLSEICRREGVRFVATWDGDERVLEWCHRTRRAAAIHYFPVHAVTFCGYDRNDAILIDNNRVDREIRIPKDRFLRNWRGYGGHALVPLYQPGVPPAPRA